MKFTEAEIQKLRKEALEKAGDAAIKAFQKEVKRASWNKTPKRLLESFTASIGDDGLTISSDHPAAKYLDKGVKPYQMTHLTKNPRPIPIIADNGEVIFRQPSSEMMSDGSWRHPGIKGKHFLDKGKKEASKAVSEEMKNFYKKLIADTLNKR
jgi:hypothetical protein